MLAVGRSELLDGQTNRMSIYAACLHRFLEAEVSFD